MTNRRGSNLDIWYNFGLDFAKLIVAICTLEREKDNAGVRPVLFRVKI